MKSDGANSSLEFLLGPLLNLHLDPVFWIPKRLGASSYWWGHVPFAHWLVTSIRPHIVVELGTLNGVSFSAFCEAMRRQSIPGRCYAIDTWLDQELYEICGNSTFLDLSSFCRTEFGGIAELVRLTFKDALDNFANGSIDLLHIDAPHSYESVQQEFERWLPKLSEHGIVLLHDTNIRDVGFGIWKFCDELKDRYPAFEFLHANGLGVIGVGRRVPQFLTDIQKLTSAEMYKLRERFALLGSHWEALHLNRQRDGLWESNKQLSGPEVQKTAG
jgi:hypothetical protein